MKTLFIAFSLGILLFTSVSQACGTIGCYDYCENSFVTVGGNMCGQTWDINRGCYKATGTCNNPGGGVGTGCYGQTATCFDYCQMTNVVVENASSCSQAWNSAKGCYYAVGLCN